MSNEPTKTPYHTNDPANETDEPRNEPDGKIIDGSQLPVFPPLTVKITSPAAGQPNKVKAGMGESDGTICVRGSATDTAGNHAVKVVAQVYQAESEIPAGPDGASNPTELDVGAVKFELAGVGLASCNSGGTAENFLAAWVGFGDLMDPKFTLNTVRFLGRCDDSDECGTI